MNAVCVFIKLRVHGVVAKIDDSPLNKRKPEIFIFTCDEKKHFHDFNWRDAPVQLREKDLKESLKVWGYQNISPNNTMAITTRHHNSLRSICVRFPTITSHSHTNYAEVHASNYAHPPQSFTKEIDLKNIWFFSYTQREKTSLPVGKWAAAPVTCLPLCTPCSHCIPAAPLRHCLYYISVYT